ncbi:hypothetical protein Ahia01_000666100 [Argonauta hians]
MMCASQDEVTAAVSALGGATAVASVADGSAATSLFLDLYAGCDVCGGDHLTEECPELGLNTPVGEFKVMSRARLTLPSNLMLLEHIDASLTVVAQDVIPAKTQFGPFEARRTTQDLDGDNVFILKILSKDGAVVCLDTSNESDCNWMCLVQCAQCEEEQNCIAYQLGTNIFYNSIRPIHQGEQLKVWYALHFAKKLGKPGKPLKGYKVMLALLNEKEGCSNSGDIAADGATTTTTTVTILQHQQQQFDAATAATTVVHCDTDGSNAALEHQMQTECNDKLYRNHILSLIQGRESKEHRCSKCDQVLSSRVELAKHLRAHLVPTAAAAAAAAAESARAGRAGTPSSKFHCSVCDISFISRSNYQRHMKKHKGQVLRCVECGYRSYRLDVMASHLTKHGRSRQQAAVSATPGRAGGTAGGGKLFEYEQQDSGEEEEEDEEEEEGGDRKRGKKLIEEEDDDDEAGGGGGGGGGGEAGGTVEPPAGDPQEAALSAVSHNNNNNNNSNNGDVGGGADDDDDGGGVGGGGVHGACDEGKMGRIAILCDPEKVAMCHTRLGPFQSPAGSSNLVLGQSLAGVDPAGKGSEAEREEDPMSGPCKKPDITKIALLEAKISLDEVDYKDKDCYQQVTVADGFQGLTSVYVKAVSDAADYVQEVRTSQHEVVLPSVVTTTTTSPSPTPSSSTVQVVHVTDGVVVHQGLSDEMYKNLMGLPHSHNGDRHHGDRHHGNHHHGDDDQRQELQQQQEQRRQQAEAGGKVSSVAVVDLVKCEEEEEEEEVVLVETVKEGEREGVEAADDDDKSVVVLGEETVVLEARMDGGEGVGGDNGGGGVLAGQGRNDKSTAVVGGEVVLVEQQTVIEESIVGHDGGDGGGGGGGTVVRAAGGECYSIVTLGENVVLAKEEEGEEVVTVESGGGGGQGQVTAKHDVIAMVGTVVKPEVVEGGQEVNKLVEFVDYISWLNKDGEDTQLTSSHTQVTSTTSDDPQTHVTSDLSQSTEDRSEAAPREGGAVKKTRGPGRPRKRTRLTPNVGRRPKGDADRASGCEAPSPKKARVRQAQTATLAQQALSVSPSLGRVLPRRRLKGIRTTGNKAVEDEEEEAAARKSEKTPEKKNVPESVKVAASVPRRRGRPPKVPPAAATASAAAAVAAASADVAPPGGSSSSKDSTADGTKAGHDGEVGEGGKGKGAEKGGGGEDVEGEGESNAGGGSGGGGEEEGEDEVVELVTRCEEGEVVVVGDHGVDLRGSSLALAMAKDLSPGSAEGSSSSRKRCKVLAKDSGIDILIDKTDDVILYACCVCGKRFTNIKYLKLHAPAHTDRFRCDLCSKRFTRKESLMKHRCDSTAAVATQFTAEDHLHGDRTTTTMADEDVGEEQQLQEEGEIEPGEKPSASTELWKCDQCKRKFAQRHLLASHVCSGVSSGGEGENSLHQCDICEQSFRTVKYLFRHLAMHTDIFKCNQCGRCFSRKDSMQKHILRCDPARAAAENIYSCHNCGRTFSTKLGLENHLLRCFSLHCFKCRKSFGAEDALKEHECTPLAEESFKENENKLQCQVCHKTFSTLQHLNNHEATHNATYKCDICLKGFSRNEELNWHKRLCMSQAIIEREGLVGCEHCDAKFSDAKEYREHFQKHTHPFACTRCGKRFVKRGSLQTHSCSKMLDGEVARCEICHKTFRSEKYLSRHQIIHGEPQYKCEVCSKMFFRKDYLNDHSCRLPDGTLVRVVRRHNQVYIHDNLICHLCGKSFVTVSNLNKHLKCHGEKTCECDVCGKRFHYITYLKEHKASVHENKYQHQCAECGKIVKTKTSLVSHMRQFHTDAPPKYTCKTCGKVFRQKGNMKTHMFSHSLEKHFVCSYCDKKFKYPDQLNRHMLEHTMTNKLMCEYCGKKFVKSYELRKHTQIFHSGMMYVCDCCNAKCGHRHTLIRHYRKKHPERLHKLKELNFLVSLRKQVDRSHKNSLKSEASVTLKDLELEEAGHNDKEEVLEEEEETIITLGGNTSIAVATADGVLPRLAAEGLHTLSNAVFTGQGDAIHPSVVEDGHTVVILQFVNQTEDGEEETVICEQEVETAVVEAAKVV